MDLVKKKSLPIQKKMTTPPPKESLSNIDIFLLIIISVLLIIEIIIVAGVVAMDRRYRDIIQRAIDNHCNPLTIASAL